MSPLALILLLVVAVIVMVLAISRFKVHPFIAIMAVSLLFGLAAGMVFMTTKKSPRLSPEGVR